MMLAYQPVKSLTKVNVAIGQGLAAANRIIPIIDIENQIKENLNSKSLDITEGNIIFDDVNFSYKSNLENKVLKNVSLIACEDTRHTKKITSSFEINNRLISFTCRS